MRLKALGSWKRRKKKPFYGCNGCTKRKKEQFNHGGMLLVAWRQHNLRIGCCLTLKKPLLAKSCAKNARPSQNAARVTLGSVSLAEERNARQATRRGPRLDSMVPQAGHYPSSLKQTFSILTMLSITSSPKRGI